jgi:hypothetical protein
MFDMQRDLYQMNNLAGGSHEAEAQLYAKMRELSSCSSDNCRVLERDGD